MKCRSDSKLVLPRPWRKRLYSIPGSKLFMSTSFFDKGEKDFLNTLFYLYFSLYISETHSDIKKELSNSDDCA